MCFSLKEKYQKASQIILNEEKSFTIDDLYDKVTNEHISCSQDEIKGIILNFIESGFVFGCGNRYEVSEQIRLSL